MNSAGNQNCNQLWHECRQFRLRPDDLRRILEYQRGLFAVVCG
jgi:hypothetical protein